ncbi:MAG: tetratricopeptide repeat protein, partial [Chloroflexi bacterium]|nr:tetratricopeptide repeat protein [Chloroflexota bacterium]
LGTAVARQAQGLAACMLGDFSAAQQALALARNGFNEVGVQLGVGIATNALGLVAERQGNAAEAENYYQEAMVIAQTGEAPNFIAFAQQDLGWLYLQTGQARKAIPLLETAAAVWEPQGDKLNHLRCQASLGLALLEADDPATAKTLAETSWAAFQQAIPTGEEPQIWLWMLYRLLTAVARPDEANHVLRAAYQELQRQSQAIADDEMRRRFFARVPLHRQIVAAHDNLTANIRYIRVTLAAIDAPLGRPLTSEEMVSVRWTIRAPEDATISGKAARRRRRLRRLLAEAKEQGAAPTDNDLAQALGVSRRTILRDMERLVKTGIIPPTRRRR